MMGNLRCNLRKKETCTAAPVFDLDEIGYLNLWDFPLGTQGPNFLVQLINFFSKILIDFQISVGILWVYLVN